jgi:hypothetical protein
VIGFELISDSRLRAKFCQFFGVWGFCTGIAVGSTGFRFLASLSRVLVFFSQFLQEAVFSVVCCLLLLLVTMDPNVDIMDEVPLVQYRLTDMANIWPMNAVRVYVGVANWSRSVYTRGEVASIKSLLTLANTEIRKLHEHVELLQEEVKHVNDQKDGHLEVTSSALLAFKEYTLDDNDGDEYHAEVAALDEMLEETAGEDVACTGFQLQALVDGIQVAFSREEVEAV